MPEREELKLRTLALEWYGQGTRFTEICRRLRKSDAWLSKWIRRFRTGGWAGLASRSRRPHRVRAPTPPGLVARILALRRELEAHRTRRTRFRGVGAAELQELLHTERHRVPSISTIERVLRRHQIRPHRARRRAGAQPYPHPRARRPGDLQQTDLVGPRYVRGRGGGVSRFHSIHTVAVVGRGIWASQVRHKTADALCRHFVAAWRWLGVPRVSQIDNEMAATGGGRHAFGLSLVVRLHVLCGVHLVFLPPGEPGRNPFVESFNRGWQAHVLSHHCEDLRAVRQVSHSYWRFYHERKRHRALTVAADGTPFPGAWLRRHRRALRGLPPSFSLEAYRDRRGRLALPVAQGRVSWIQKVDAEGHVTLNARRYFVGKRQTGQYVQATLFTHRHQVVVYSTGRRRLKSFTFPIAEPIVAPLLPQGR